MEGRPVPLEADCRQSGCGGGRVAAGTQIARPGRGVVHDGRARERPPRSCLARRRRRNPAAGLRKALNTSHSFQPRSGARTGPVPPPVLPATAPLARARLPPTTCPHTGQAPAALCASDTFPPPLSPVSRSPAASNPVEPNCSVQSGGQAERRSNQARRSTEGALGRPMSGMEAGQGAAVPEGLVSRGAVGM